MTLERELVERLLARGLTISSAESCTGGWFAKRLVDVPGASAVFPGGVVSYAPTAKTSLLGVPAEEIQAQGVVSPTVAKSMAKGVRARLATHIGISVTGLAGPGGGTPSCPIGRVYIGLSTPDKLRAVELTLSGGRAHVRRAATDRMLALVLEYLDETEKGERNK